MVYQGSDSPPLIILGHLIPHHHLLRVPRQLLILASVVLFYSTFFPECRLWWSQFYAGWKSLNVCNLVMGFAESLLGHLHWLWLRIMFHWEDIDSNSLHDSSGCREFRNCWLLPLVWGTSPAHAWWCLQKKEKSTLGPTLKINCCKSPWVSRNPSTRWVPGCDVTTE